MKEHKKVPALRFLGFEGEWEAKKIGHYLEEYVERVSSTSTLPILTSSRSGLGLQKDYFNGRELQNEGEYGVVPRGYFTYRHMSDDAIFQFNINTLVDRGAISKEYPVFRTKGLDAYFLQQALNFGNAFRQYAVIQKQGGTRTRLYFKHLAQFRLLLPSLPEQQKIASFLTAVDTRIQQLSRKKELLEQYKQGVMQRIFSREIRFKDEDGRAYGEWEEKQLGTLTKIYDGTHQTPHYVEHGVPFYSVEHLTGQNFNDTKYISEEVFEKENERVKLEKGDILMTRIGDIGTSKYIDWNVKASFYVSLALIKQSTKYNSEYLNQYIGSINFQKELYKRTIHVAFPKKINLGEIGNCLINLPSFPEQQKIAAFLTALDARIHQVARQIAHTQGYKQGLLQQMFV